MYLGFRCQTCNRHRHVGGKQGTNGIKSQGKIRSTLEKVQEKRKEGQRLSPKKLQMLGITQKEI